MDVCVHLPVLDHVTLWRTGSSVGGGVRRVAYAHHLTRHLANQATRWLLGDIIVSNGPTPMTTKTYKEIIWKDFDFDEVMDRLLKPGKGRPHHKNVLFGALGAWVLEPTDKALRRQAISQSVRLAISRFEKEVRKQPKKDRFSYEELNRPNELGRKFINEIYYPIGGIRALAPESHTTALRKKIEEKKSLAVSSVVLILEMVHYWSQLEDDSYLEPSFIRADHLLREYSVIVKSGDPSDLIPDWQLDYEPLNRSRIETIFSKMKYHTLLWYAASHVPYGNTSLMERFLHHRQANFPSAAREEALRKWIAYSLSYSEMLRASTDNTPKPFFQHMMLPDNFSELGIAPVPFPAPKLEQWKIPLIEKVLSRGYTPDSSVSLIRTERRKMKKAASPTLPT